MKYIFSLLLIALSHCIYAQDFSTGFRTGLGKNFFIPKDAYSAPCQTTWDKQVFLRYESKGRFAIEVAADHYKTTEKPPIPDWEYFEAPTHKILDIDQVTQYYAITVSAQYDITCNKLKETCPIAKNLKSYIGVLVQPVFMRYKTTYTEEYLLDHTISKETYTGRSSSLMGGLSHTLLYSLTQKLVLSSVFSYKVDVPAIFSTYSFPRSGFENHTNYQIGLGYTL